MDTTVPPDGSKYTFFIQTFKRLAVEDTAEASSLPPRSWQTYWPRKHQTGLPLSNRNVFKRIGKNQTRCHQKLRGLNNKQSPRKCAASA